MLPIIFSGDLGKHRDKMKARLVLSLLPVPPPKTQKNLGVFVDEEAVGSHL